MSELPVGAIPSRSGGYIVPMTSERAKAFWREKRKRAYARTPDPTSARGAVWWRRRHADELAYLTERYPTHAARLIDLRMCELMLPFMAERRLQTRPMPEDFICGECRGQLPHDAKPLLVGAFRLGWFHPGCAGTVTAALLHEARAAIAKVLSPRRAPP